MASRCGALLCARVVQRSRPHRPPVVRVREHGALASTKNSTLRTVFPGAASTPEPQRRWMCRRWLFDSGRTSFVKTSRTRNETCPP
eukprot:7236974-Prymnesium_polylepis.1